MNYIYNARLEDNGEGGLLVTFPDVPEAITEGARTAWVMPKPIPGIINCQYV